MFALHSNFEVISFIVFSLIILVRSFFFFSKPKYFKDLVYLMEAFCFFSLLVAFSLQGLLLFDLISPLVWNRWISAIYYLAFSLVFVSFMAEFLIDYKSKKVKTLARIPLIFFLSGNLLGLERLPLIQLLILLCLIVYFLKKSSFNIKDSAPLLYKNIIFCASFLIIINLTYLVSGKIYAYYLGQLLIYFFLINNLLITYTKTHLRLSLNETN